MTRDEIQDRVESLLGDVDREAYARGLREGASRLEFWSALVPGTTTKQQILESLGREAARLRLMAENNGGDS